MKKVLFVATMTKAHINVFHIPFLKMFKELGWDTSVAAKNDFPDGEDCIVPYCDNYYDMKFERFPFKPANFKVYKELKKLIESERYDIIHCHTPVGGVIARLAARKARKNGTRVIYTAHGFHFFKGAPFINWLIYYPVERFCAQFTDCLITINKEDYERANRFKVKRVEYVPGVGIDTKKIFDTEVKIEEKRKELDIPVGSTVLCSVGELNKNKNHEVVINAIDKLNRTDIYLVICCKKNKKEYLEQLAARTGLGNKLKLLGYRTDVSEIYKACDIFVFPSFREGLSVSLMEAMAAGLPCVVSRIRGNIDLIDEDKGGFLIDPHDIKGFSSAINIISNNRDIQQEMSKYNLEKVSRYDSHIIMKRMKEIYETVWKKG